MDLTELHRRHNETLVPPRNPTPEILMRTVLIMDYHQTSSMIWIQMMILLTLDLENNLKTLQLTKVKKLHCTLERLVMRDGLHPKQFPMEQIMN